MFAKLLENVRVALNGLGNNKLRSALTMLGITIGVTSVVLLVSLGQAVEQFVVGEFTSFGTNLVFVFGEMSTEVSADTTESEDEANLFEMLKLSEAEALADPLRVPDARYVAPILSIAATVNYNNDDKLIQVAGIDQEYPKAVELSLQSGREFSDLDMDTAARVAIVDEATSEKIFGEGVYPVGQNISIDDVTFQIIGVLYNPSSFNDDDVLLIPLTTMYQRLYSEKTIDGDYPINGIALQALSSESVAPLEEQVRTVLREERDLDFDEEDDFLVFSQQQFLDTLGTITGLLTTFLGFIAGISLVVGGIGIMNIMLVTVTERTKEIGLRKAVGARKPDILVQFLTEAVTLALIGGAIGTALAIILSILATNAIPNLNVEVHLSSIILATGVSIFTGAFFGAYPANRAAGMNPIDALRYE